MKKNCIDSVNRIISRFLILAMVVFFGLVNSVLAANLNYSVNTLIGLSSPAIQITILTSSVATSLVVGTGTLTVTVPSGGRFALSSASRDLSVSGSDSGVTGVIERSCSSDVAYVDIVGKDADRKVTLTPTASTCSAPSVVSAGGSGGAWYPPTPTSLPVTYSVSPSSSVSSALPSPSSTESLKNQINSLLTLVESLQKKVSFIQLKDSMPQFKKNLELNSKGEDTKWLQNFLINQSGGLATAKLKKYGPTGYFGNVTKAALKEFQKNVGIKPASGILGPLTKAYINSLLNK